MPTFWAAWIALVEGSVVPVQPGNPVELGRLLSEKSFIFSVSAVVWFFVWIRLLIPSDNHKYWLLLFLITWFIFILNRWNIDTLARLFIFQGLFTFSVLGEREQVAEPKAVFWASSFRFWICAQILISLFFAGFEKLLEGWAWGPSPALVLLHAPPDWLVRNIWVNPIVFSPNTAQILEVGVIVFELALPFLFLIRRTFRFALFSYVLFFVGIFLFLEVPTLFGFYYLGTYGFLRSFYGMGSRSKPPNSSLSP